jgi:hypothetical protein
MAIFLSTIAIGQITTFEDNFDSYLFGQQLACQNPTDWKTWTNSPCSPTEDAFISNLFSFSGDNSVFIKHNHDIVKEIGAPINIGIAEINFQVFIPSGKAGYFNTLANFAPPTYEWAMQVFFNSNGNGALDAGGANAATFSYPQDQWFPVKVVSDLTANLGELWLDGVKIHSWQWTLGTFGTTISKQLDGTDFYGSTPDDEMYIDDYSIVHTVYTNKIVSTSVGGNWNANSTWVGNRVPNSNTRDVEIVAGATVTLVGNITRNRATIVKGTLNCGSNIINGSGSFTLASGSEIQIGSASGISLTGASGNIQVTGSRSFSKNANYIYNGNIAQNTGNGLPASVKHLIINNSLGVSLSSSTNVSKTLELTDGNLITSSYTLSLGTSPTNLGALSNPTGKIIGNFNRQISNSASPILFPVGVSSTKYTPVTLNNISGTGTFNVSVIAGAHPNVLGTNVLQMYWKLTNGGITSADVTFNYLDEDVVGNESNYVIGKYDGNWSFPGGTVNTTTNQATITGVTSFSDWSLGDQSALPVELSSFSASTIGSNVKLSWQTETEVNNYGFEVERASLSASPLRVWEKIGFVNGNGNSNSPKSYSFEDKIMTAGEYSYRLKQIDNDGQFEYSKTIEVDLGAPKKFELSQNYPNPFNPTTTIKFSLPEAGNVKLTLFNILGQEVKTLVNESKESGVHTINFSATDGASELNSGIYIYKLESGSFTQTRKMTLVK